MVRDGRLDIIIASVPASWPTSVLLWTCFSRLGLQCFLLLFFFVLPPLSLSLFGDGEVVLFFLPKKLRVSPERTVLPNLSEHAVNSLFPLIVSRGSIGSCFSCGRHTRLSQKVRCCLQTQKALKLCSMLYPTFPCCLLGASIHFFFACRSNPLGVENGVRGRKVFVSLFECVVCLYRPLPRPPTSCLIENHG